MIKADYREAASGIPGMLAAKYGLDVVSMRLKTGDYIVGDDVVIERKSAADFVQSVIDGRLFMQAARIKKSTAAGIYIVEGDIYNSGLAMHKNAIKGAIVSLSAIWKIPVVFSENTEDTGFIISLMANQKYAAVDEFYNRTGRRPKQFFTRQAYILQGFPGIGPKLARALLESFGSIEGIVNADIKALTEVRGMGGIKAGKMKELVTKKYAGVDNGEKVSDSVV